MSEKLVDRVNGVRLDCVVRGEDDKLWNIVLEIELSVQTHREPTQRTGLNPPGGFGLAQLQLGSRHFEVSQEYPAASTLVVGPESVPSWASVPKKKVRHKRV